MKRGGKRKLVLKKSSVLHGGNDNIDNHDIGPEETLDDSE